MSQRDEENLFHPGESVRPWWESSDPFPQPFQQGDDADVGGAGGEVFQPFMGWDYFDADEGDPEAAEYMPAAGWNQQPEEFLSGVHFNETAQWGGSQLVVIAPNPLGGIAAQPVAQILDMTLKAPARCLLRLSSQALDGIALGANDVITWVVNFGVGNSQQTRKYQQTPSATDGSTNTDISLDVPVQHVSITATVQLAVNATNERRVNIAAQIAPNTLQEWMVR